MPGADLELNVARVIQRGRLLEQAIHDQRPWSALVHGCCEQLVPARRQILDQSVVFTAYLAGPLSGIRTVDLYCGDEMVTTRDIADTPAAPCRITVALGARPVVQPR